jgi:hypothetical protein
MNYPGIGETIDRLLPKGKRVKYFLGMKDIEEGVLQGDKEIRESESGTKKRHTSNGRQQRGG